MKGADQLATRKAAGLLERSAGLPDTFWYTTKRRLLGPPLVNHGSRRTAAVQAARARRAVTGRDLLLRLRHRGNPHRAGARARHSRVQPDPAHDPGHLVRHGARAALLPRDRHGLHQARRIVRGGPGELRAAHRPGMRGRAAHRLRGDRGGPDRGGDRRGGLRLPGDRPLQARDLRRRGPAHVPGKPARDQGGGPGLRRAHLPVRGRGHLDDHRRADPSSAGKPAAVRPARAARHLQSRLRLGRADHGRDDLHPAARVRQRRRVADRNRGGLGRRRRVPAPGGP